MDAAAFAERAAAMQERLDAPDPTTWRPDDPSEGHPALLIGELLSVQEGMTKSYGPKQIAVIRDVEGQLWSVWLLHTVLVNEFFRQQPRLGEMVAIRWEGRVSPEGGAAYEKYSVVVDRPGGQVAWRDAEGGRAEPVAAAPPPFAGAQPEPAPPVPQPLPPAAEQDPTLCPTCGFANGRHAAGCSEDIPF
jgi:hypothetical protein